MHSILTKPIAGAYVPLTKEGNIIVDGVLTSCYADFHHDVAHLTMTPMQRLAEALEWVFGADAGFSNYVNIAREFGILLFPDGQNWSN